MKTFKQFLEERKKFDDKSYDFDRTPHKDLELSYDKPSDIRSSPHKSPSGHTYIKHKKSGISYEIDHQPSYNSQHGYSRIHSDEVKTHGHKPAHHVSWGNDSRIPPSTLSHGQRFKLARDAKRVWDKHIKDRIPAGHLVSNDPDSFSYASENRRNPEKNTRASIYRKHGFGVEGERSGRQYSAKIGKTFHPIQAESFSHTLWAYILANINS